MEAASLQARLDAFNSIVAHNPNLPDEVYNAVKANDVDRAGILIHDLKELEQEVLIDWVDHDKHPEWINLSPSTAPSGLTSLFSRLKTSGAGASTTVTVPPVVAPPAEAVVTETELISMWDEIDNFDVSSVDAEVIKSFEYVGFDPNAILKSLLLKKKTLKISNREFLNDITILCGLAVVKGSITDKNITKMSDAGKAKYTELEARYGIVRGGSKGKPGNVVTVARIGAAFPGTVISVLQHGKTLGRQFVGELKTHQLPRVIQHQAFAAIIPEALAERSKMFLLNLNTAYAVEQTRAISNTKGDLNTLLDRQIQFTLVTHNANYPKQEVKTRIFKFYNWAELLPQIYPVATHIKTKWLSFNLVTEPELLADIMAIP